MQREKPEILPRSSQAAPGIRIRRLKLCCSIPRLTAGFGGDQLKPFQLHILPQHLLNAGKTQKSRLSRSAPPLHRVRSLTPDPSVAPDRAGGTPEPDKSVTSLKSTSKPPPRSRGSPANGFRCKFTAASGVFDSRSSRPGARPGQGEGDLGVAGLEQGAGAAGQGRGEKRGQPAGKGDKRHGEARARLELPNPEGGCGFCFLF